MASLIDQYTMAINVSGTAQITQTNAALDQLQANLNGTSQAATGLGGNARNVAFQVQDMAVQIAGGTNAFVAMGQQIPQLLGGFGVMGAVIGAVAAIAIPLLQAGLKAAGVDMRNLDEINKDLSASTKNYEEAVKQNGASLDLLKYQFGDLAVEAKKFYDLQQENTKIKAGFELGAAIGEARNQYGYLSSEIVKSRTEGTKLVETFGNLGAATPSDIFKNWRLGLTADQAVVLGDKIKQLDQNAPEKNAVVIREIDEYLKSAGLSTENLQKAMEKIIFPLTEVNANSLKLEKDLDAAAKKATDFNAALLGKQAGSIPGIAAARRANDQISAARMEAAQKISEFESQLGQKDDKDRVDRSKELAAFAAKTNAEAAAKAKDFQKSQADAYRSAELSNDAKSRQIDLESQILDIQDKGRSDYQYNVKFNEDIARSSKEYADSVININEQRRKNLITEDQMNKLIGQGAAIYDMAAARAEKERQKRIADAQNTQRIKNIRDELDTVDETNRVLGEIEQKRDAAVKTISAEIETQKKGNDTAEERYSLEQSLLASKQVNRDFDLKVFDIDKKRAAEMERINRMEGLTQEDRNQLRTRAGEEAQRAMDLATRQRDDTKKNQADFVLGWDIAFTQYSESAKNANAQAGQYFATFTKGFEDAIVKFVRTGKLSFTDLANSIIEQFVRIQVQQALTAAMTPGGGSVSVGSLITSGFSALGGLLGFKAEGGPVGSNQPYIVGEKGPELFIPQSAGSIVPNSVMGSNGNVGTTIVNYSISAVDASSFRSLVARDPSFIYAVTEQGRRSQPSRRLAA
jgi:lambda family phage tail tape measure protein